jgi:DNA-binding MarR family transcriptional regulator
MITITNRIFEAVNHTCTGTEAQILFVLASYPKISTKDAMRMTGITQSNHYFRTRKNLIDKGYIYKTEDGWQIDEESILSDYTGGITC